MEQINPDVLNQGLASARGIVNALKAFRAIEDALTLYAQTQATINDLAKQKDALSAEVSAATAACGKARAELDQEVVRLAEYRKTEKAKIDEDLRQARNSAQKQVLTFQGAVEKAEQDHASVIKELKAEREAKRAEIAAEQKAFDKLKAEHEAFKQKVL